MFLWGPFVEVHSPERTSYEHLLHKATVLGTAWPSSQLKASLIFTSWPRCTAMWDPSSLTRYGTCFPCIGRMIFNNWTTGEIPVYFENKNAGILREKPNKLWQTAPMWLSTQIKTNISITSDHCFVWVFCFLLGHSLSTLPPETLHAFFFFNWKWVLPVLELHRNEKKQF